MQTRVAKFLMVAVALVLGGLLAIALPQGAQAAGAPGKAESPPKPLVLHFKCIPAQSFLETLMQLGKNSQIGDVLKQMPIALNEPANSVVVLVPPELAEFLTGLAKSLDTPNEFRDAMMQQERQNAETHLKLEEARHKLGLPQMHPGPMGPPPQMQEQMQQRMQERMQQQMQQQMQERKRPGEPMRPGAQAPQEAPGRGRGPEVGGMLPEGEMLGHIRQLRSLLEPQARQELKINEEQAERIQKVLATAGQEMAEAAKRMQEAVTGVPAEKRPEAARDWWQKNADERAKRAENVRREVFEILAPEQRERAEKWLHEHAPGAETPRRPQVFRGSDGPVPTAPSIRASGEQPARFFQVQNEGGPPQGMGGGMAGMMNMFSPEERDRMQQIMQRAQDLRYLDDPDVRTELKINPDQEKKFQDLKDRAQALFQAIGTDVQARIKDRMPTPDMTDEQRLAAIEDIKAVVADTVRGALNEVEGMVGEANGMLTEEQRTQLKTLAPQLTLSDLLTNGLSYLGSTKARDEFAFTYDQSEKIKMIVRDLETDVRKDRDDVTGKEPTAEELQSEKFAPFRTLQKERIKRAFDRILTILTTEQREKVQKWYDTRMTRGPRGMGRGFGRGPGGGGPGGPPPTAAPKPDAPKPAAPPAGTQGPSSRPPAAYAVYAAPAQFSLAQFAGGAPNEPRSGASGQGRRGSAGGPPGGGGGQQGGESQARMGALFQQAQSLSKLSDPEVAKDLKLSPQQEKQIRELNGRAKELMDLIRKEMQGAMGGQMPPGISDEERQNLRRQNMQAMSDKMQPMFKEFEAVVGEASTVLTDEQKAQLKALGAPQHAQPDTTGLAYLTTPQARQEFAFSADQADRIKSIVRDTEAEIKRMRDAAFGPNKQPTPEELRSDTFAPLREEQKVVVKNALGRIMTILTGDQRDKVQKWFDTRSPAGRAQGARQGKGGGTPAAGGRGQGGSNTGGGNSRRAAQ